jgi:predicted PolB exonuclease-like 3'-5' exonuclease
VNSASISAEIRARRTARPANAPATAFLILDTESVPDGRLLSRVKYPGENLSPEAAIDRAQAEAREQSRDGSDFLPVTFQVPVSICVLRVASDFTLQALTALDAPHYRPEEMVRKFWQGVAHYKARLVTFNGRGFDMPLLELAAFRQGLSARDYFYNSRNRFNGNHIDLCDWLSNYGACRLAGGLNLLAKLLGKPGKMEVAGDQVYAMHRAGQLQQINDYCMCDTLDTYFVFLRTRVLLGEMPLELERLLVQKARTWLAGKAAEVPALRQYLDRWEGEEGLTPSRTPADRGGGSS